MSIVVNGITILENVANALNVNGTNITSVVCNGVPVWTQSLFNALWSGSSLRSSNTVGLETSGSSYRMKFNAVYGVWRTVNTSGLFSGESISAPNGIDGMSLAIRAAAKYVSTVYGAYISFNTASKAFSGSSLAVINDGTDDLCCTFEANGGLLRFGDGAGVVSLYGQYISLT